MICPDPSPGLKVIGLGESGMRLAEKLAGLGIEGVEFFCCLAEPRIVKLATPQNGNAAQADVGKEAGSCFWDSCGLRINRGDLVLLLLAPDERHPLWLMNKIHDCVLKASATLTGVTWCHNIADRSMNKIKALLRPALGRRVRYLESLVLLNVGNTRFPIPAIRKFFAARDVFLEAAALVSFLKEENEALISSHIGNFLDCWPLPQFIIASRAVAEGSDRGLKAALSILEKMREIRATLNEFEWLVYSVKASDITCEELDDIGHTFAERMHRNAGIFMGASEDKNMDDEIRIMVFAGRSVGDRRICGFYCK